MDQNQTEQHYIQTLDHHRVTPFHFSKKSIRILLSISVFSLLFSCFPLLIWFSHCISQMSMQLSGYTSDRHCIFLFCNGILVFLIRNSILPGTSPPATDSNSQQSVPHELAEKKELSIEEVAVVEQNHDTELHTLEEEAEEEEEEEEIVFIAEEEEEEEIGLLSAEELNKKCDDFIAEEEEEEEEEEDEEEEEIGLLSTGEQSKKCDDFIAEEEEEEEEEDIGLLSTEELNKKCDDFIRKMREGIKIEAQKLIMV